MKNKIRAVIFDMDGVIVDSEPLESKALSLLLKEYGNKPILNNQGLIHKVGVAGDEAYNDLIKTYKLKEELPILKEKKRKILSDIFDEGIISIDGFLQLMKQLKKNKIKVALASNRFIGHVLQIVKILEVADQFEVIVGPSPERKHKPAPDIYLEAARQLKVKPKECVVIEDSEIGITSAHLAGMKIIAVPNKYTAHHDFSKADRIVKSLRDINIKLIQSL